MFTKHETLTKPVVAPKVLSIPKSFYRCLAGNVSRTQQPYTDYLTRRGMGADSAEAHEAMFCTHAIIKNLVDWRGRVIFTIKEIEGKIR